MNDNRVSAVLTPADVDAVMAAIATIRQKLPFLIDLTPEERHDLPKMGDKSRAFVSAALTFAQQNVDILPRFFDVEEMNKDVSLFAALQPIYAALTQLYELLDDTTLTVGSEAYTAALLVYHSAQGTNKGAGLDELLDAMGQRFARKSRGSAAAALKQPAA